jgi:hypothetical protein
MSRYHCIQGCARYWCRGGRCAPAAPSGPATASPGRAAPTKPILHQPGPVTTTPNQPVILERSGGENHGKH